MASMIDDCRKPLRSFTIASSWEIWKHVWSVCDLKTLSHDDFVNDGHAFPETIWTCFDCVNGIDASCKTEVEIMTGGSVAEMIRSEKRPVNWTSIWSGFCNVCHENGFSRNGANYGDCHCHFDGDWLLL